MKKEIEFLQGAFDSYKSSLHQETNDKWARKKEDLETELEQKKSQEIQELSRDWWTAPLLSIIIIYKKK